MSWDGREFKNHQASTPVPEAGLPASTFHAGLDQAAHGPIQPGLGLLQGWGMGKICFCMYLLVMFFPF